MTALAPAREKIVKAKPLLSPSQVQMQLFTTALTQEKAEDEQKENEDAVKDGEAPAGEEEGEAKEKLHFALQMLQMLVVCSKEWWLKVIEWMDVMSSEEKTKIFKMVVNTPFSSF
jgi:hypothetical protein